MDSLNLDESAEAMLKSLSPASLSRLLAIKQAYPDLSFQDLPEEVKREIEAMFQPTNGSAFRQNGQHSAQTPTPRVFVPTRPHTSLLGIDTRTGREVRLASQDRLQGLYILGATGTGKTTLLERLILEDIRAGDGVALIEPHGDLTRAVIAGIPHHRLEDLIYLDMSDSTSAVGINLFQCDRPEDPTEAAKVASFLMYTFEKVWNVGTATPQLAQVLRNICRTLIENPGTAFSEISLLLWEEPVREKLTANLKNVQTRAFWQQYNHLSIRDRYALVSSCMNKIDAYLNEPMIANILSQTRTTIDFRRVMDDKKILLINLSPQLDEMSRLVGSIIIGKLLMSAFSRVDLPEQERRQRQFNIYVDEYSRFAGSQFRAFIEEVRKFSVSICLAHQSLSQIYAESERVAPTGAANIVVFRVAPEDAKALAGAFSTKPTREIVGSEPVRAPVSDVVGHLLRRGHTNPVVSAFTSEYLARLDAFIKKAGTYTGPIEFGCTLIRSHQLIEGQRMMNEVLGECMHAGRADLFIPPYALFILGGAADDGIPYVFLDHLTRAFLSGPDFLGIEPSANRFGRAGFLANEQAVNELLTKRGLAKKRHWDDLFLSRVLTPGRSFLRMLRSLRATMEVLAREPIMVDTGQYQPKYQMRTYADQENENANELSQLANFHAKVRLLTGQYTIRTLPAPQGLTGSALEERIRSIKARMLALGYTRPYSAIEQEVRARNDALRQVSQERPRRRQSSATSERPPTKGEGGG